MDTSFEILNNQISYQINRTFVIHCGYTDTDKEYFGLIFRDSDLYIKPVFMKPKLMTPELASELLNKIGINENDQIRDISFESDEKYDDFWNRFYNNLPKLI